MLVKTYELPPGVGTQPFAKMAAAHGLRRVELLETAITVEGSEDDQAAFADRLEQLTRLWRAQRGTLTEGRPLGPRQDAVGKAAGAVGAAPAKPGQALNRARAHPTQPCDTKKRKRDAVLDPAFPLDRASGRKHGSQQADVARVGRGVHEVAASWR